MAKTSRKSKASQVDTRPVPVTEAWAACNAELWPIERVKPNPRNSRVHGDGQIDKIARLFREYGQTKPVLVDEEGVLIAGHGTRLGALRAGCKELAVVVANGWSEAQKRAYMQADNRVAEDATWDEDILAEELAWLQSQSFDLSLTAFGPKQLDRFLAEAERSALRIASAAVGANGDTAHAGDTDAPSPPKVPTSRAGDVWLLGEHRLLCGDSTNADDVARCLDGAKTHLMVTDPPYGVDYAPDWRNSALPSNGPPSAGRAVGRVANDGEADWRAAWALFEGDVVYCWHAGRHASTVQASLEAVGFEIRCQVIWAKDRFAVSRGDYHWQHEPCWYAVRKGRTGHWCGLRDQTTLWEISHRKSETGHGTQKPLECMRRPIMNNSKQGDFVYEPFSGSGTTLIACEDTKRICRAIEIDPAYVDVAVERWQTFTGKPAIHAETGEEFMAVNAARRTAVAA